MAEFYGTKLKVTGKDEMGQINLAVLECTTFSSMTMVVFLEGLTRISTSSKRNSCTTKCTFAHIAKMR